MGTRSLSSPKATVKLTANIENKSTVITSRTAKATATVQYNQEITFGSGIGVEQSNRAWDYEGTIVSGASLVIDLYDLVGFDVGAGDGRDLVGQELRIEEIVAIAIKNNNTGNTAGQLEVQPDSTNGWTAFGSHTVANGSAIKAQGCILKLQPHSDGLDVEDGSNHRLKLTANGADVKYQIVIFARHDDEESSSSSSSSQSSSSSSSSESSSSSSVSSASSSSSQSSSSESSSSESSSSSSSSSISSSSASSASSASSSSSQSV